MTKRLTTTATLLLAIGSLAVSAWGADQDGWIKLFDGKDLSAWDNGAGGAPAEGWAVEDGTLVRKKPAGYVWSKQAFGDFILELEFKTEGNSGVFFRTGNPRDCVQTGLEMQVDRPSDKPGKHTVGALCEGKTPADWRTPDPENTLYLELDSGQLFHHVRRKQIPVRFSV